MKSLQISKEIQLPIDAVTQTFAAIGRKGAGKTYLASMIAEQMLDLKAQVVVIDPIGNWYGLRIGKDGKSKGKDIFVIGGQHGDIPVVPEAGAKIARLLVEKSVSVVLDVSEFRLGERKRFAADFAEELLHLKKSARTPVHIFIEEAQLFIPQFVGKEEARMVGAFEQIVRLGRNYGIGATLITQRPQSVNKEVLSQVECLCVLQITGPQERKAIEYWVQETGSDRKLIGELPSLARGEGFVWSPAWLKIFKKVHFSQKTTFDTSATPVVGKLVKAAQLSKVDIEQLREDMTEVITQAEKDDPKALKRRIAELEKGAGYPKKEAVDAFVAKAVKDAIRKIETERFHERNQYLKHIESLIKMMGHISKISGEALKTEITAKELAKKDTMFVDTPVAVTEQTTVPPAIDVDPSLMNKPQQRMVNALAWGESVGIMQMEKTQLALFSDQSPKSSAFGNNLGALRTSGWVTYPRKGMVALTPEGRSVATHDDIPTTTEELHHMLFAKLSKPQVAMLEVLINHYPHPASKETISHVTGQSITSSAFGNNLGRLRSLKLIDYPAPGEVVALPVLFIK
jgi:hypothetical protein